MDFEFIKELSRGGSALQLPHNQVRLLATQEEIDEQILALQREIAIATGRVSSLEIKAAGLERDRNLCAFVTSSVRLLPFEILSKIFTLVCVGDAALPFFSKLRRNFVPPIHNLAQVCTRWRDVAQAHGSELWGHQIVLDLGSKPIPRKELLLAKGRLQAVAALYPEDIAHIQFRPSPEVSSEDKAKLWALFEVVFDPKTCKALELRGDIFEPEDWAKDLNITLGSLDVLDSLFVSFKQTPDGAPPVLQSPTSASTFSSAMSFTMPQLRKLGLHFPPPDVTHLLNRATWATLTHLSLGGSASRDVHMNKHTFVQLLKDLSSLTNLHIFDIMDSAHAYYEVEYDSTVVKLPKLRVLEIHFAYVDLKHGRPCGLWDCLSTPALEQLDFVFGLNKPSTKSIGEYPDLREAVLRLVKRAPRLQRFRVAYCDPTWMDLGKAEGLPPLKVVRYSGGAEGFPGRKFPAGAFWDAPLPKEGSPGYRKVNISHLLFSSWPVGIVSLESFIDRFLERKDTWFDTEPLEIPLNRELTLRETVRERIARRTADPERYVDGLSDFFNRLGRVRLSVEKIFYVAIPPRPVY